MIETLEVDGFKSLSEFKVSFHKGLNILIGPNGAGKSNICQALGLLGAAAENEIASYLLSIGGVENVLTRSAVGKKAERTVMLACTGTVMEVEDDEFVTISYDYNLQMVMADELRITSENLSLSRLFSDTNRYRRLLQVRREGKRFSVQVQNSSLLGTVSSDIFKRRNFVQFQLPKNGELQTMLPLLSSLIYFCFAISLDLRNARAWNIDPYVARQPSDILEPSTMLPDGRRLSNALNELARSDNEELSGINEFLSRVISGFGKFEPQVFNVETSGAVKRSFSLTDIKGIQFSASGLSDGTIKLIALLVGLSSLEGSTAIVEEPENYLHPWACQSLIEYLRESYTQWVFILTTHSETILNSALPNEVLVVQNENGISSCSRVSDDRELSKSIEQSGFGCGYHYVAGALGGIPQ